MSDAYFGQHQHPRIRLHTPKICSCGAVHKHIPSNARHIEDPQLGGWYWECSCRSTLFHPESRAANLFEMPPPREPMGLLGALTWALIAGCSVLAWLFIGAMLTGCGQYLCPTTPSTCDAQEPYGVACEPYGWYASRGLDAQAQDWLSKCHGQIN